MVTCWWIAVFFSSSALYLSLKISMCCFITALVYPSPTFDSGLYITILFIFALFKTSILFQFSFCFFLFLCYTYIKAHGSQWTTQQIFIKNTPPVIWHRCRKRTSLMPPSLLSRVFPLPTSHTIEWFCLLLNSFYFKVCLLTSGQFNKGSDST